MYFKTQRKEIIFLLKKYDLVTMIDYGKVFYNSSQECV